MIYLPFDINFPMVYVGLDVEKGLLLQHETIIFGHWSLITRFWFQELVFTIQSLMPVTDLVAAEGLH